MRKEAAVSKLLTLLPLVRRVEAKMVLLKILPVFFGHAEVFNQNLKEVIYMTRMLLNHPLFVKEKSLFGAWFVRLLDASKRSAPRSSSNEGAQKVVAKNFVHKFVSIPGTDFVDPIGYAELDFFNSFLRFLKFHKLHKYLYFFANLSFVEIQIIGESNIQTFEDKVDIFPMTTGARRAILRKLGDLNNRASRLTTMKQMNCSSDVRQIEELIEELKTIIRTPIRGITIYTNKDDLPNLLTEAIEKTCTDVRYYLNLKDQRILPAADQLVFLLKRAWSYYFFSEEQKSLFNQLRSEITSLKKNFSMNGYRPIIRVQKPKKQNPVESQSSDLLDGLIAYMEDWLKTRDCLERF